MSRSGEQRWCLGLSLGDGTWSVALRDRRLNRAGILGRRSARGVSFVHPWVDGPKAWAEVLEIDPDGSDHHPPRLPKRVLDAGLPYRMAGAAIGYPLVQWHGRSIVLPNLLSVLAHSLTSLLDPDRVWVTATGSVVPSGVLQSLSDVVVGYPTPCSEAFRFNNREVVLAAGLVASAGQVTNGAEGLAAAIGWDGVEGWGCCWVIDQQGDWTQVTLIDRDFGRRMGALHGIPDNPMGEAGWLDRLNSALNHLCCQSGAAPQKVERILVRGDVAHLSRSSELAQTLADYLRQKCPSAIVHWEPPSHTLGRLAMGLTLLLDRPPWDGTQPYDDYFLFASLLRQLSSEPQPLDRILEALEHDGIHGRACRRQVQQLLAGHIPPGLLPNPAQTPASQDHPDYQALAARSPFQVLASGWYALDATAGTLWRRYLGLVWGRSSGSLLEPIGSS